MLTNWKTILKSIKKIKPILKEKQIIVRDLLKKRQTIKSRLVKKALLVRKKSQLIVKKGQLLIQHFKKYSAAQATQGGGVSSQRGGTLFIRKY